MCSISSVKHEPLKLNVLIFVYIFIEIAEFLAVTVKVRSRVSEVLTLNIIMSWYIFNVWKYVQKIFFKFTILANTYEQEYTLTDVLKHYSVRKQKYTDSKRSLLFMGHTPGLLTFNYNKYSKYHLTHIHSTSWWWSADTPETCRGVITQ
jgi:hypothetical protein